MKMIRVSITEGDRMWYAHGETREEALHHLRIVINGEIRSGLVTFEDVDPDAAFSRQPTQDTPSDASTA
jgi:hypothetical protein